MKVSRRLYAQVVEAAADFDRFLAGLDRACVVTTQSE
jgi:hypothetical protein